ncbi:hypothetical protein [Dyella lutea]|uniref:Minor tail protein Z (GPZ) n=1 Tax=Dyella lutea TaxID=2950441 RepID=A0ABT1FF93_9GAMM|nr:hypothetical protein [Dyella lutea]MCP1376032.1 hypothetical protein [Dyella lutea]
MNGIELSVRTNVKDISKKLSNLANKQLDFATAQALTTLAKQVQQGEKDNIRKTFKHPKPFTVNAVGVRGATKRTLTATVFVRPIAAKYLKPYEEGGRHVLPGRALLNPKDIRLDQYGQLTRATLKRLKARRDVFIGPMQTKHGTINGVWQRVKASKGQPGKLKLLIRFGDALPVTKRLGYAQRARTIIDRGFNRAFGAAMGRALATAR